MTTRIVKLPNHNSVLIGRDFSNIFKNGYVYEIKEFLGEYVIICLGKTAITKSGQDFPNVNSTIQDIFFDSEKRYFLTEDEYEKITDDKHSKG